MHVPHSYKLLSVPALLLAFVAGFLLGTPDPAARVPAVKRCRGECAVYVDHSLESSVQKPAAVDLSGTDETSAAVAVERQRVPVLAPAGDAMSEWDAWFAHRTPRSAYGRAPPFPG